MKNNKYFTLLLAFMTLPLAAMERVPLELDFSTAAERAKWQRSTSNSLVTTHWEIGNPDYAYGDDYMLFTSYDGGATCDFSPVDPSVGSYQCLAYYPLDTLPQGDYTVELRYRGVGYWNTSIYFGINTSIPDVNNWWWWGDRVATQDESGRWWKPYTFTFHSDGNTKQYLYFYFRNYEQGKPSIPDMGYAIDAIQIYQTETGPSCAQMPLELEMHRDGTDMVVSWAGNASEYQMEYFLNDTSLNTRYTVDNIVNTYYAIHPEVIPEGAYTIRVRSICGRDTSAWSVMDYQLIYDIAKHCMDYMNFEDPNVNPQYGYTWNPGYYNDVQDYGFLSSSSRHSIHCYPRDLDGRTNYKLRTFPKGEPAAIRLGNWETSARAEDIIYTMDVTEDMAILLLRYALVMQLPGHNLEQQPRFTLEFLDENGTLIDSCGYVDFTPAPDFDVTTADGWHMEIAPEGETNVIWKDWSLIGLNMRNYIGQTVKIRITTKDCTEGAHYGYAYFTMSCSPGTIQGVHCGMKPDHFTVEEGFYYRWYKKYDPNKTVLSTERTYYLTDPMDTATYCVDMINMLKPECYFTLEASSLAFIPNANGTVTYEPSECKNYIQLTDMSTTQGVYWDESGTKKVVRESEGAEEILWDLGLYGTSTEHSPKIPVPDAGDTLHITLHTYMENKLCEDVKTFDIAVPAVGTLRTIDTYYFCHGGSYNYKGQDYTTEVEFSDTLIGWNGCDSISTVALRFYHVDTVRFYDTICSGHSLEWSGMTLTEGGEYFTAIKSIELGCDSVHNILYLHQYPYLDMALGYEQQAVCETGGSINVPFSVNAGEVLAYDLLFSDLSKQYGFTDRILEPIVPLASQLTIDLTDSMRPGLFDASIVFHNLSCDSLAFPITFAVYYDPASLITQRWNDFLAVRKSAYDFYGGFKDYQWYMNDQPMVGETGTQLYVPEGGLDKNSTYAVEVTRISDGMRVRTCPYYPTDEPNTVTITVMPTVITPQDPAQLHIRSSKKANAELYNQSGNHMASWEVHDGDNIVEMPTISGLYLLYLTTESGEQHVRKIIVQ